MEYPEYEELMLEGMEPEPKPRKKKAKATHTVVSRDTWGSLIAVYGPEIVEFNGRSIRSPLVAGTVLRLP